MRLHKKNANGAAAARTEREALAGRPSVNHHGKAGQPDDSPRLHLAQQRQLAQEHADVIQRVEVILLAVRFPQVLLLLLAALADVDVVPELITATLALDLARLPPHQIEKSIADLEPPEHVPANHKIAAVLRRMQPR